MRSSNDPDSIRLSLIPEKAKYETKKKLTLEKRGLSRQKDVFEDLY